MSINLKKFKDVLNKLDSVMEMLGNHAALKTAPGTSHHPSTGGELDHREDRPYDG